MALPPAAAAAAGGGWGAAARFEWRFSVVTQPTASEGKLTAARPVVLRAAGVRDVSVRALREAVGALSSQLLCVWDASSPGIRLVDTSAAAAAAAAQGRRPAGSWRPVRKLADLAWVEDGAVLLLRPRKGLAPVRAEGRALTSAKAAVEDNDPAAETKTAKEESAGAAAAAALSGSRWDVAPEERARWVALWSTTPREAEDGLGLDAVATLRALAPETPQNKDSSLRGLALAAFRMVAEAEMRLPGHGAAKGKGEAEEEEEEEEPEQEVAEVLLLRTAGGAVAFCKLMQQCASDDGAHGGTSTLSQLPATLPDELLAEMLAASQDDGGGDGRGGGGRGEPQRARSRLMEAGEEEEFERARLARKDSGRRGYAFYSGTRAPEDAATGGGEIRRAAPTRQRSADMLPPETSALGLPRLLSTPTADRAAGRGAGDASSSVVFSKDPVAAGLYCTSRAEQEQEQPQQQQQHNGGVPVARTRQQQSCRFATGWAETIGSRMTMEDAVAMCGQLGGEREADAFLVLDGHGGSDGAAFVAGALPIMLESELAKLELAYGGLNTKKKKKNKRAAGIVRALPGNTIPRNAPRPAEADRTSTSAEDAVMHQLLVDVFARCNALLAEAKLEGGATACVAYVTPNRRLHVANVGDTRAVLAVVPPPAPSAPRAKAHRLSVDHKPNLPSEQDRITELGGFVTSTTDSLGNVFARVAGVLAVARAFGDFELAPYVSVEPHTSSFDVSDATRTPFLILACDGVWDVMTDDDAVRLVEAKLRSSAGDTQGAAAAAAEALRNEAWELGSMDNISVVVIILK